jgi:hypothetical protein
LPTPKVPVKRFVPMLEVAMTEPLVLTASKEFARPVIAKEEEVAAPKTFLPEKVLLSERSVEDAPLIVIDDPTLKGVPLIVPREPVRRLVPIDEVAITFPLASVERIALEMPENQVVPSVVRVLEAFAKDWSPVQLFALARLMMRLPPLVVSEEPRPRESVPAENESGLETVAEDSCFDPLAYIKELAVRLLLVRLLVVRLVVEAVAK